MSEVETPDYVSRGDGTPVVVTARHNGWCPICKTRVLAGVDEVVKLGERWVHEDCAS